MVIAILSLFLLISLPGSSGLDEEVLIEKPNIENTFIQSLFLELQNLQNAKSRVYQDRFLVDLIFEKALVSLHLGLLAALLLTFFWSLLLFYMGVFISPRIKKWLLMLAGFLQGIPSFVLAPLLIWLFALKLNFFPAGFLESPLHYVLPLLCLILKPLASLTEYSEEFLKEIKGEPLYTFVQAKGLPHITIYFHHLLPLLLLKILPIMNLLFFDLLLGSFFIEIFFSIPGLSLLFSEAIAVRDYPLMAGICVFYLFVLQIVLQLQKCLLTFLDPRRREENALS